MLGFLEKLMSGTSKKRPEGHEINRQPSPMAIRLALPPAAAVLMKMTCSSE
jgi:hypothetical protein